MEKIEYSEETLAQIEQYASIYLKISDMAVLFDIPAEQLREDIADRCTEVSKRYHKGKAASKVKLLHQEMQLAYVGSPLALENAQKSTQYADNANAQKIIGMSAMQLKQNKVAAEAFEAYLSMNPNAITKEAGIVYNLGTALMAIGENDKACGYFQKIAQDAKYGEGARYQITQLKCK